MIMDHSPHAGMSGVNLPAYPFHGPKQEQLRLLQAVRNNIGPCNCVVHTDLFGNSCPGHPCEGHLFLCETDEPGRTLEWTVPEVHGQTHFTSGSLQNCVTRLDRLMYIRNSRETWLRGEGWEVCIVCDRASFPDDPQHKGHAFITVLPPVTEDKDTLPW